MNNNETEKDGTTNKKSLTLFILATFFSLPSGISLVSVAIVGLRMWRHIMANPQADASYDYAIPFMFGFPFIIIWDIVAFSLIVLSWLASPRWCRFVLPFYLLLIISFIKFLFEGGGGGYGP